MGEGGARGRVPPPTAKEFLKIGKNLEKNRKDREKRGKNQGNGKNWEKAKIWKVLSLCPS